MSDVPAPGVRDRVERLAYSPTEAAACLGISRAKLYELIASGDLQTVTLGRRRLVRVSAITALLDSLEAA